MKLLKNLAVSFLSFLLFLAIVIFGFLFAVKNTALNPDFITSRINEVNVTELMDEFIEIDSSPDTSETFDKIKELVPEIEPLVKERLGVLIHSFYDYLLEKEQEPDYLKVALGKSFLNPEFVASVLDKISLPELIDEMMPAENGDEGLPEEFIDAVSEVIADFEPELKEKVAEISGPVFDYILGKTQSIDLSLILREKVLNEEFVIPLIEKLDLSSLAGAFINEQLINQIPPEMEFLAEHVDEALVSIEPAIKDEISDAAIPLLDYLLGDSSGLSIEISLEPVLDSLEEGLKEEFMASPPAEFADLSQSELEQTFNEFFSGTLAEMLPSTFELDESILGPEIAANISGAMSDVEDNLMDVRQGIDDALLEAEEPFESAREYISYFQIVYTLLIVFIGVMVLAIILILRDVRSITRRLGIPLLIYGAIEYAGIYAGRYFLNGKIPMPDIPPGMENMIYDMINSVMRPLEIFSLSLLIIGLALTVTSFVYKRGRKEPESPATE